MTTGTHVLIVDDEAGFRELMRRYLEAAGYEVRTATNAHEALHSIRESPPAVTVCDIHMPGPTGLWLAEQIRQHSPATAMVLATSDAAVPPTESMRRGVVAYILKPYQRDQVVAAVAAAYRWWAEQGGGEVPRLEPRTDRQPVPAAAMPAAPATAAPRRALAIGPATLLLAVIVVVLLLAAAFFLGRQSDNDAFGRVAAASGVVLVFDSTGTRVAQGSGFFVAPDLLVTNRHVVSGGTTARVVGAERRPFDVAGVVAVDPERDLALLRTTGSTGAVLTLAGALPDIGDAIAVYGAPLGLDGTLTTGIVSANRSERGLLQITAPLSPGSSGSPVFTPDGTVVGVAVAANLGGQALSFAIPSAYVAQLLAQAGTPRPLVAAARGAGDDRERHELIGPVRSAAITLGQETTRLLFDRQGRLLEKTAGDVTIQYAYDEHGRLASETHLSGEEPVNVVAYVAADGSTLVGDNPLGLARRLTYDDRHRLVAEEQLARGIVVDVARWNYDGPGWPGAGGDAAEFDALGNPARGLIDGVPVTFSYRMDGRGNWVERHVTSVTGDPALVRVDRRRIDYWD